MPLTPSPNKVGQTASDGQVVALEEHLSRELQANELPEPREDHCVSLGVSHRRKDEMAVIVTSCSYKLLWDNMPMSWNETSFILKNIATSVILHHRLDGWILPKLRVPSVF